jgi:DNA-binding response OmpR family regulator
MNLSHTPLELLLVEDSHEDIFFFRRALAATGINVSLRVATNGKIAIDMLSADHLALPDVMFLDLKMPLLDGFDVLRWVGCQNFSHRLHIIVLSGSPHEKDQLLAASLGAAEYLVKPITADQLRNRLLHLTVAR